MQSQHKDKHSQQGKVQAPQASTQEKQIQTIPIQITNIPQEKPISSQQQSIATVNQPQQAVVQKQQINGESEQQPINLANQQQQQNVDDNDNESSWTDATESVAADDQNEIWVVDDDIINAMDLDSGEQDGQEMKEHQKDEVSDQNSIKQEGQNQIDLEQLEQQFVKGKQSNEDWRVGKHQTFCTTVAVSQDKKSIFTGGGDDYLLCYRGEEGQWKEAYKLKHSETVSKIDISFDGKYVVSYTQNQAFCTDLTTLQSAKFDIQEPADLILHKQGGVAVLASEYTVSIYNLKGLSLYTSYTLDIAPSILSFCDKGKQVVAVGQNKLRIITPKTGEIVKGNGEFHKEQISSMVTGNNMVFTGCIQGKIFASNLNKGTVIGQLQPFKNIINLLYLTDQYLLVVPQGEGVHWVEANKMKRLFHHPKDISVTDIVEVPATNMIAISDLDGRIHIVDRRKPTETIKFFEAGNTVHKLTVRGSEVYAACEDGCVRVFDVSK